MAQPNTSTVGRRKSRLGAVLLWIFIVMLAAGLGYTLWQNQQLKKPDAQTEIAREANQKLVDRVSQIILVPEGDPTVANIVDVDALRKQNPDFYKDAQNGDRLLLYSTKAIIYREAESKIINVAPVIISPNDEGLLEPTDGETNGVNSELEAGSEVNTVPVDATE
jgi:hypothetical protein